MGVALPSPSVAPLGASGPIATVVVRHALFRPVTAEQAPLEMPRFRAFAGVYAPLEVVQSPSGHPRYPCLLLVLGYLGAVLTCPTFRRVVAVGLQW